MHARSALTKKKNSNTPPKTTISRQTETRRDFPPFDISLVVQPVQKLRSEIRHDNSSTGSQDALGGLESHGLEIKHARLCGGANHGVLARHLVRSDGHVLANLLGIANDVQILTRGLDHDDIGALANVSVDGSAGQAPAAGRQLVAPPVAKRGGAAGGVAEGPVQAAGELCRVGHEDDFVGDAGLDELELDGADAAVVHVRGGDAVGAGLGVGDCDVRDAVDAQGVVQGAVFAQDAAVAVRGVFAEADVGDDEEGGEGAAEEADGADYGA